MTNSPHVLDMPLEQLEAADEACRCPLGFPLGHVDKLIETMTRTGKECRCWAKEYEADGKQDRADYYHKQADRNLAEVNYWINKQEAVK